MCNLKQNTQQYFLPILAIMCRIWVCMCVRGGGDQWNGETTFEQNASPSLSKSKVIDEWVYRFPNNWKSQYFVREFCQEILL